MDFFDYPPDWQNEWAERMKGNADMTRDGLHSMCLFHADLTSARRRRIASLEDLAMEITLAKGHYLLRAAWLRPLPYHEFRKVRHG